MPDKRRLKRLEVAILETVAPLVSHGLADPRLGMVTVTRVSLAPDLSIAHVNWSTLGGASAESKAAHALEHARGKLQSAVAKALQTRVTPHLVFHFDESLARAQRVSEMLEKLARERAEREGTPPVADPPPGEQDEPRDADAGADEAEDA